MAVMRINSVKGSITSRSREVIIPLQLAFARPVSVPTVQDRLWKTGPNSVKGLQDDQKVENLACEERLRDWACSSWRLDGSKRT